eukprot:1285504-Pleurochrysis_carterae.AAC.1
MHLAFQPSRVQIRPELRCLARRASGRARRSQVDAKGAQRRDCRRHREYTGRALLREQRSAPRHRPGTRTARRRCPPRRARVDRRLRRGHDRPL